MGVSGRKEAEKESSFQNKSKPRKKERVERSRESEHSLFFSFCPAVLQTEAKIWM